MSETIGTLLYKLRRDSGKTILQVARETHTSPGSFSNWENDRLTPTVRTIRKLADYYGVESEPLITVAEKDSVHAASHKPATTSDHKVINMEDFFDAQTTLTFGSKQLPANVKQLTLVFLSGVLTNYTSQQIQ